MPKNPEEGQEVKSVPVLKCNEFAFLVTDAFNLSEFIGKVYGTPFDVVEMEEWRNDSSHRFSVKEKRKLEKHETKAIQQLRSGSPEFYTLRTILQDMVNNDNIRPGNYLVNVCW